MTLIISREKILEKIMNYYLLFSVTVFHQRKNCDKVRISVLKLLVYVWILDCTPSFLISESNVSSYSKIFISDTKCSSIVHAHSKMAASNVTASDFMSVPSTHQAVSAFGREQ